MKSKILKEIVKEYDLEDEMTIYIDNLITISKRKNIEINDLLGILGIYESDKKINYLQKKKKYVVRIYTQEDMYYIKQEIIENFKNKEDITYGQFIKLNEKYRIKEDKIVEILNLDKHEYRAMKLEKSKAKINIQSGLISKDTQKIINEIRNLDNITLQKLYEIKNNYCKTDLEMQKILNIRNQSYYDLINQKIQKTKIDPLSDEEKIKTKEKIKQLCKGKDNLTFELLEEIREITKANDTIIMQTLSINKMNYYKLDNKLISKTRIIFSDVKRNVFLTKMDFKYYEKTERFKKQKLKRESKKLGIEYKELVKNLDSNLAHYELNLLALDKNKQGIYIGKQHPMSNECIKEHESQIRLMINRSFYRYCSLYQVQYYQEEIEQDVFHKIILREGVIEKNFSFDKRLFLSIISTKTKYHILYNCQKAKKEEFRTKRLKEYIAKTYDINDEGDISRIINKLNKKIYKKIIIKIYKYEDIILKNRKKGLELIAQDLELTYDTILEKLEEMQRIIVENGIVKKCKDGTYIIMNQY